LDGDDLQNLFRARMGAGQARRDLSRLGGHFSTAEQAAETAAKHFAGLHDLVLVAVDADTLGHRLKWEPSRGGALFPHLYGGLELSAVQRVDPLPLDAAGRHVFPKAM
jgi:uncharacterized protein (DUF952 family)